MLTHTRTRTRNTPPSVSTIQRPLLPSTQRAQVRQALRGGAAARTANEFGPAGGGHGRTDFPGGGVTAGRLNYRARLVAGDQPGETENVVLGGEPGEGVAAAQPQAGPAGGDATSISTTDLSAAEWKNNGEFKWWIRWVTDGTSGWIVQKIENTYSGTLADGSAITNASVGVTPMYYEAWEVDGSGTITGSLGATGNRDRWERPNLGALGSQTSFSMKGTVYWTNKDPAASGFTSGGVANAGTLLSSTSAPAGIGSSLLVRNAYGAWASNGAPMLPGCFTS